MSRPISCDLNTLFLLYNSVNGALYALDEARGMARVPKKKLREFVVTDLRRIAENEDV